MLNQFKKHAITCFSLCLLLFIPFNASAFFYTGNTLSNWLESNERVKLESTMPDDFPNVFQLQGYITGIYESLSVQNSRDKSPKFCPSTTQLKLKQLIHIVNNFVKNNPKRLNEPAYVLVETAIIEAYPCNTPN